VRVQPGVARWPDRPIHLALQMPETRGVSVRSPAPRQERRSSCSVCAAPGAVPLQLPPPADGTLLCPRHASELASVVLDVLADMRAKEASRQTLHGRRLHDGEALAAIRAWAVAAGYPVSARGGVAAPIIAAYREACLGSTEQSTLSTSQT
jgi:hypothetical protein